MLKHNIQAVALSFLLCVYGSCADAQDIITVAVASSFYPQAMQYSKQFEAKHHVQVRLVAGSTGRLFNQIKQGAPFDIFIAADTQYATRLMGKQAIIAHAYLGLKMGHKLVSNIHRLLHDDIKHIAMPNPQVAPFGKAAQSLLTQHKIWQAIKPKLVYAQHAMQADMMVSQGLVDAGFVATTNKSMALAELSYQAVLLSHKPAAQRYFSELKP